MLSLRIPLSMAIAVALVLVSGASGVEIVGYTATGAPSSVKPSTQSSYAITLTNDAQSQEPADKAKIGIPAGFVVSAVTKASTSAAGDCVASTWIADGTLIADGKINLKRPGGGSNSRLCPGATLTVVFSAMSSADENTYLWVTELLRGEEDRFVLTGSQPSVQVDGTAPVATITSHPLDPTNATSATFSFSANEPATFQCRLDGSSTDCVSPKSYPTMGAGTHDFRVKATDLAGNTGPEVRYQWRVDTAAPALTITQKPPAASNSSSATFGFVATDASEPVNLLCKLDAEAPVACTSKSSHSYSALSDGPHTFTVIARDAAGNSGEAGYAWTIETAPPTAAITQKPGDPTNSRAASFAFAANEPATFQCKLDDGPFAACSSPQIYGDLVEGRHTFVLRVTDSASNAGPDTPYAWTIDMRAPAVAVTAGPSGLTNSSAATLSFSADEPSTFQCSVDGRGFEPCSSPAAYGGLSDGGHAFAVRATDAAGNVGAASRSWTVDATPPQTTLDSRPAARTTATSARFTFSASEPATFQCRLGAGSFSPCASPKTYAGLARGLQSFAVRAIDPAGNVDATPAAFGWTVRRRITRTIAASALMAPASGARVTRPPLLRWRAVSRATYYNVQLYRAGRKVLTAWPTRTRLQLGARWAFNKRDQRLAPGVYRWYVWPGYGKASARRYGRLLGTSSFVVVR